MIKRGGVKLKKSLLIGHPKVSILIVRDIAISVKNISKTENITSPDFLHVVWHALKFIYTKEDICSACPTLPKCPVKSGNFPKYGTFGGKF